MYLYCLLFTVYNWYEVHTLVFAVHQKESFLIFTQINEGADDKQKTLASEKMFAQTNHSSNKEAWKSFLGQLECLDH